MRLDESLADGKAQAVARGGAALARANVLLEEPRDALGRDAAALVGDRDREFGALAHRGDPDGGGFRRVARGVGEEVDEHLHDAPAVGLRGGQPRGQVDDDGGVTRAASGKRAPRPFHEFRHLRGLGRNRERARVDAPRIEEVADEPAHVLGLSGDDAEELARFGRVERGVVEQRCGRALDGGERLAELVAHEPQELGAQPFDLVERGEVLKGHHHRGDGAAFAMDG